MGNRQVLVALLAALAVYFLYMTIYGWLVPVPPAGPRTQPPTASQPATAPAAAAAAATGPAGSAPATAASSPPAVFARGGATLAEDVVLGGGPQDALRITLHGVGAAVETIQLTRKRGDRYVHRASADRPDPYILVRPVHTPTRSLYSLATSRLWVPGLVPDEGTALDEMSWELMEHDATQARFQTTLVTAEGSPLLRVSKLYRLVPGSALLEIRLSVENLSDTPLEVSLQQDGAFGIPRENTQAEMRRLLVAGRKADGEIVLTGNVQRNGLKNGAEKQVGASEGEHRFLWMALVNKYFGVFLRPLAVAGPTVSYVQSVVASPGVTDLLDPHVGGVLGRIRTRLERLEPSGRVEYAFEVYAGAKDAAELRQTNPAFADRSQLAYIAARDVDTSSCCPCQFAWLTDVMTWLLEHIYALVRNYGVAIMILVLIVRTLLHPLSVFQQKAMYRSSEAMARLQPKLQAIREKYPNDRVRQNQEMMQLYADEGVNPAAPMIGMIPLFIQMPILIALWTALNTDVHLRHAPFDGWWIRDLSAPDALVKFDPPGLTIPILGWLVPFMFANIPSLNLLPILMGISMWLQQKYMPKPHMQARRDAAAQQSAPQPRGSGGMSPEEQLRQQQMIANLMSVMFPLMFYYMPSGLNLYWMATNVFGIVESLIVRRQIEAEKLRRQQQGQDAARPGQPGLVARLLQHMARQAEDLQKKADQLSERDRPRPRPPKAAQPEPPGGRKKRG